MGQDGNRPSACRDSRCERSATLLLTLGAEIEDENLPDNLRDTDMNGFAKGSFVRGPDKRPPVDMTHSHNNNVDTPNNKPQGVIGNWNVGNDKYNATGVFAGSRQDPR